MFSIHFYGGLVLTGLILPVVIATSSGIEYESLPTPSSREEILSNIMGKNKNFKSNKIKLLGLRNPFKYKRQRSKSSPPCKLRPVKVGESRTFLEAEKSKRKVKFLGNWMGKVKEFTSNDVRAKSLLDLKGARGRENAASLEGLSPARHNGVPMSGNDQSEEVTNEISEHPSGRPAFLDTLQIASVPTSGPVNDSIAGNSIMAATENNTRASTQELQDNRPSPRNSLEIIRLEDKKITLSKLPQHSGFVRVYKVNGSHILGVRTINLSKKIRNKMFGRDKIIKPFLHPLPFRNGTVLYPQAMKKCNGSANATYKLFHNAQFQKLDKPIDDEKIYTKLKDNNFEDRTHSQSKESFFNYDEHDTKQNDFLGTPTTRVYQNRTTLAQTKPLTNRNREKNESLHRTGARTEISSAVINDRTYKTKHIKKDKISASMNSHLQPTYISPMERNQNISSRNHSKSIKSSFKKAEISYSEPKEDLSFSSSSEMYNSGASIDVSEASSNHSASPSTVLAVEESHQYPIFLSRKYPTSKSLVLLSRRYPFMIQDSANLPDYNPAPRQHKAYYIEPGVPSIPTQQIDPTFPPINVGRRQRHLRFKWRKIGLETDGHQSKPDAYLAETAMESPPFKKDQQFSNNFYESSIELPSQMSPATYDTAESTDNFGLARENQTAEENITAVDDVFRIKTKLPKFSFTNFRLNSLSPSTSSSHSVSHDAPSSDENIFRSQRESNAHKETNAINKNKFGRSGRPPPEISKIPAEPAMVQKSISGGPKIPVSSNHVNSFARSSHQTLQSLQIHEAEHHRLPKELTELRSPEKHRDKFLQAEVDLAKPYFLAPSPPRTPPLPSASSGSDRTSDLLIGNTSLFSSASKAKFQCQGRYPGYYADLETNCQEFHVCQRRGRQHTLRCPAGTRFSQRLRTCDRWSAVACAGAGPRYDLTWRAPWRAPWRGAFGL